MNIHTHIKKGDIIMKHANNDIANKIKTAIKKAGISQPKLAEKMGVTYPAVNQWTNGTRRPSPITLLKIAEGLNINISELIGLSKNDTTVITTCEKMLAKTKTKLMTAKQNGMPDSHIKLLENELAIRTEQLCTNIKLILCIDPNIYDNSQDDDYTKSTAKTASSHEKEAPRTIQDRLSQTLTDIDKIKAELSELQSCIETANYEMAANKSISQADIKTMRKHSGLTQKELADKIGISLMSMRRYENNERIMPDKILQHVTDILS